ncbi:MAG: HAF repeat-containing protein [Planctomycetota bacterium]
MVIVGTILFETTAAIADLAQAELIDLGTLGGNESGAYAISDTNKVVGYSKNAGGDSRAFLWEDGIMTDLGTLGGLRSCAYAINDSNQVVGWADNASGYGWGCLWENGAVTNLGNLGNTPKCQPPYSEGYAINNTGVTVGVTTTTVDLPNPECQKHAFLWENGEMADLGTLGGNYSIARAVNDSSQVVGYANSRAFLWEDGIMTDLGTLGGSHSYALGLNNAGQVVGYSENASVNNRAFLWDNNTMTNLGTLGGSVSYAYGINDANQVVGYSKDSTGDNRAFLWENGVMTDLNTLLPEGAGWELLYASDINNNGQIVGYGYINNEKHAFLLILSPSEPYCVQKIPGDANGDCKIDFADFAIIASHWLECNLDPPSACWE